MCRFPETYKWYSLLTASRYDYEGDCSCQAPKRLPMLTLPELQQISILEVNLEPPKTFVPCYRRRDVFFQVPQ